MTKILVLAFTLTSLTLFAQTTKENKISIKKGFAIGLGFGAGSLSLHSGELKSTNFSASLPNLKLGYFLNEKAALWFYLPGTTYKDDGHDRGFEALAIASQFWITKKLWLLGGVGVTFDAPAFYEVKNPDDENFNIGFPALTFSAGYEVWSKGRFSLDLQYRFFYGKSNLPDKNFRKGNSNIILIGLNWY